MCPDYNVSNAPSPLVYAIVASSSLLSICCTDVQQSLTIVCQVSRFFRARDVIPTILDATDLCIEISNEKSAQRYANTACWL